MRLYEGQIPSIADDIARTLIKADAVEIDPANKQEFELDIQSILREYVRQDRELTEHAKDLSAQRGSGYSASFKIKRQLAREKGFKLGEDAIGYIIQQLIEIFFQSMFVEDIYMDDNGLRRTIAPVLRKHMGKEEELDSEVRDKIKNLDEGTRAWDEEYQRVMSKLKRINKLED